MPAKLFARTLPWHFSSVDVIVIGAGVAGLAADSTLPRPEVPHGQSLPQTC
jgi:ribulose 1,5-bisphosphate synthetase/thiazole synthase